ncbi:MAG: ATP-binding protein, partial [Rikenellaceae bacterium]
KLVWTLTHGVNVLSGPNGSGKSTLIQAMALLFRDDLAFHITTKPYKDIEVEFEDGTLINSKVTNSINKNIDIITTFDTPLKVSEAVQRLTSNGVITDLDWELYSVLGKYIKYQLAMGKKAIELLLSGKKEEGIAAVTAGKILYFDILDRMFEESGKKVVRSSDELLLISNKSHHTVTPYQLSSGEKQLIIILTTVLIHDNRPAILIMDEPEISMHHEWQKGLISNIVKLNPAVQIIATTHSPAIIMDGWIDRVTDISDISE